MDTTLRPVDLLGADLREADLRFTCLTGTKGTDEQLTLAASLKGAILPDGTVHE